ncbi:hypothetical protein SY83_12530 [Paenibacillus swuensis]|uniref:ABC transporter substrate-binding protein n=1 Tax=Paenibacillus swuensis TaxID=1178515 RepID=A0A172TJ89_9BACL|nr:extracellular solute-binding protein [Paenibacillus swuensis]ANE46964.1 hypothetical protein SY83_12530 [Paenibacillus swuensis]
MKKPDSFDWEAKLTGSPLNNAGFNKELMRKVRERVEMNEHTSRKRSWKTAVVSSVAAVILFVGSVTLWAAPGLWEDTRTAFTSLFQKEKTPDKPLPQLDPEKEYTLKFSHFNGDNFLMMQEGQSFIIRHPNMNLQVTQPRDFSKQEDISTWLDKTAPDVITIYSTEEFTKLIEDNRLLPLDTYAKRDGFALGEEAYEAGPMQLLREYGNGTLYGLAPQFETYAVYYNEELFKKFGVDLPTDNMTWDELLALADRFAGLKDGAQTIYGLEGSRNGMFDLIQQIGMTNNLRMGDLEKGKAYMNTAEWRVIWERVLAAYERGTVHTPEFFDTSKSYTYTKLLKKDAFASGYAAMKMERSSYVSGLLEYTQKENKSLKWNAVSAPVYAANPEESTFYSFNAIYAINANSQNPRAAWELIKHLNSKEVAQSHSYTYEFKLPTRSDVKWKQENVRRESFYTLRPSIGKMDLIQSHFPLYSLIKQASIQADLAAQGKKSLDDALTDVQQEAQHTIAELKAKNEDANTGKGADSEDE